MLLRRILMKRLAIPLGWQKTPVKWLVMALSLLTASTTAMADAVDIHHRPDARELTPELGLRDIKA